MKFPKTVQCQECGKLYGSVTNTHVQKFHNITLDSYVKKYPNSPIRSIEHSRYISEISSIHMKKNRASGVIKPPPLSEENRRRVSERMRLDNPMKKEVVRKKQKATMLRIGYNISPRTDEARKRYSEAKMGDKNPMKRPEVAMKNAMAHNRKKSSIEIFFDEIVEEYDLPFEYVGNNKLWIGRKNPDYVCTDTEKKLVLEVTSNAYNRLENNYEVERISHFNSNGYRCITVRFTNCQVAYKQKLKEQIALLLKTFLHESSSYQIYHSTKGEASSIQL